MHKIKLWLLLRVVCGKLYIMLAQPMLNTMQSLCLWDQFCQATVHPGILIVWLHMLQYTGNSFTYHSDAVKLHLLLPGQDIFKNGQPRSIWIQLCKNQQQIVSSPHINKLTMRSFNQAKSIIRFSCFCKFSQRRKSCLFSDLHQHCLHTCWSKPISQIRHFSLYFFLPKKKKQTNKKTP